MQLKLLKKHSQNPVHKFKAQDLIINCQNQDLLLGSGLQEKRRMSGQDKGKNEIKHRKNHW